MRTIISRVWSWAHRPSSSELARVQRAELHLDLPDALLVELAVRGGQAVDR